MRVVRFCRSSPTEQIKFYSLDDPNLPQPIATAAARVHRKQSAYGEEYPQVRQRKNEKKQPIRPVNLPQPNPTVDLSQLNQTVDQPQLKHTVEVIPKGPVCSKCNRQENLWMSLVDETVLCKGCFNHSNEHRQENPPIVNLEPLNDDCANKTMGSNNCAIDANKECVMILETKSRLTQLHGPGYIGLENLGNTCYLSSVMQVLFAMVEFRAAYRNNLEIFRRAIAKAKNPSDDFNSQMAKLACGLYSNRYATAEQKGIRPITFKQLVGRGHPEFSTSNQQDAEEFFRHILDLIEKSHKENKKMPNLSSIFKFKIENRTQCLASGKVDYAEHDEYVLSLPIPLEKASNRTKSSLARPKISLLDCLEKFASEQIIDDYVSPATKRKTKAVRHYRIRTYPEFLMLHMQKFSVDSRKGQTVKIDCSLDVPEMLDLAFLRGEGLQYGEQLLPYDGKSAAEQFSFDKQLIGHLFDMHFPLDACKRALLRTGSKSLDSALEWLYKHRSDYDYKEPIEMEFRKVARKRSAAAGASVSNKRPRATRATGHLRQMVSMGYSEAHAIRALKAVNDDIGKAIDWIKTNFKELHLADEENENDDLVDGKEQYQLIAFISHIGESAQDGHYVCYIRKNSRWILYDDDEVTESKEPPFHLGYMFLYRRLKFSI